MTSPSLSTLYTQLEPHLQPPSSQCSQREGPGQQGPRQERGDGEGAWSPAVLPAQGWARGSPGRLSLWQVSYCTALLSSVVDRLAQSSAYRCKCASGEGHGALLSWEGAAQAPDGPWGATDFRVEQTPSDQA